MKKILLHGITAGIMSAAAGVLYFQIYQASLGTAFDKIINPGAIAGASIIATLLMSAGSALLLKLKKEKWSGIFNLLILILSFASIIGPIGMSLPLDIESPELFPGLVVPMHFFPALTFFALTPFFTAKDSQAK